MSFEWPKIKLQEVTTKLGDGLHGTPVYDERGEYYFINGNNLENGFITISEKTKKTSKIEYLKHRKELNDRTILVSINGTIGNVALYRGEKIFLGKSACYFNVVDTVEKGFVFYVMVSRFFQDYINSMATGSTIKNVSLQLMRNFEFHLPPLKTQKEIASILSSLDNRISLLRETNTTLEAIAQTLFKSWFVDFDPVKAKAQGKQPEGMDEATAALFPSEFEESALGLIPKGWRVGTIKELGEVICGKTPPTAQPENYGDEVPFITIPDMHNVLLITSTNRSLSKLGANTQKKKYLPVGSICVSCIATAGLVARVTVESQTNQQINSVVPFDKWGKSFPLFILRRIGDAVRAGGSGGSIFHNLNKSNFEQLSILLPNQILAHKFEIIVEPIIHQIENNQKQSQTLTTLRDTLLPRLISGQLRINQAQDVINEVGA